MMSDALLKIKNLKTWLGTGASPVRAIDGIDLEIKKGETFALLGESGCGKSMTALSIMRLLPPVGRIVDGSIHLGETSLLDLPENMMRRERGGRIGMIFQEPATSLNPVLTVGSQIAEAVRIHDTCQKNARARVVELLKAVGIPDPEQRFGEYPHQLSGGMKQRVMIAMALAGCPQLLIADEPTTALDVTIQAQVLRLMKQLQQETGMAILLITHDLGVVAEVADRVAIMYAGQIVETASCKEFFQAPRHPYSQKLFQSIPGRDKRAERLAVIKGTVPLLNQEFRGCRFADRCDAVMAKCHYQLPQWDQYAAGQGVRCHLQEIAADQKMSQSKPVAEGISKAPSPKPEEGQDGDGSCKPDESASFYHSPPLLAVKDLKVHFPIHKGIFRRVAGHVRAVDGLSLEIPVSRTLAVVGESGCGKTTVGKAILQLIKPTGGQVQFDNHELTQLRGAALRRRRSDLQIIFQDPMAAMNPRMLVRSIVEEGMLAQGIGGNAAERRIRVEQLLEQVGLPASAADCYPHEFSGGQRQRICVARALAVEPRLIICDEPTSALDVSVQAQILNLLQDLQQQLGLSYLFITHDISVVAYLAHEVAVMYLGRIIERGTVAEVLDSPQHPYTQALLSAVPVTVPGEKRKRIHLEGDMPSPASPPVGCHFHPRCPQAMDRCKLAYPEAIPLSETSSVSCLLLENRSLDARL